MHDHQHVEHFKTYFKSNFKKGILLTSKVVFDYFNQYETPLVMRNFIQLWFDNITKMSFLKDLPHDFEELFLHSYEDIYLKKQNKLIPFEIDLMWEDLVLSFEVLAYIHNRDWNQKTPFLSMRAGLFNQQYRITMSHSSLSAKKEAKFFLRKIATKIFSLSSYTQKTQLLSDLIEQKKNILVAGATGSGKTSFLSSMIERTSDLDHLVCLEDTYEIVSKKAYSTRLLAKKNQSLDNLLHYSLRMSPDRIVIGELRSKEIVSYIQALNTGHTGVFSTVHANNAKDALHRLATLLQLYSSMSLDYQLALKLVCKNIDYVVFLKNKKVDELIQVYSSEANVVMYDQVE